MYKNANSGDCPLVIDKTTPSCGNSRFGCWVCTVVKRDKSMEGLVENGEDWMYPLLELRDLLAESRDRGDWREKFGRDGRPKPEGQYGPYKPWVRAMLLRKLLEAQYEIQQEQGDIQLISHQELVAIQKSKSLMVRNRGLNKDIEKHLERYIDTQKTSDKIHTM